MPRECLDKLLKALGMTLGELARRLGGGPEHYLRAARSGRLPFPVWDALERLAHREGWCWNVVQQEWVRERTVKI